MRNHRSEQASAAADERQRALVNAEEAAPLMNLGIGIDADDNQYRRLTSGAKFQTRDLSPLAFERQLEVAWYLFESNPFAHRLITLMTDLVIGEGFQVDITAEDERIQKVVDQFLLRNQLGQQIRTFYQANSLNGELVLPVAVNPVTGIPVLGYLDPAQIKAVVPLPDNVLVLDELVMKSSAGQEGQRLKIIRENPATGKLEGEVFFHKINSLPNSLRGRSDLMPLADWLDLYDQFMFAEVERVTLISSFAWDLKMNGADENKIKQKAASLPKFKPGTVYIHNENEELTPRTPSLNATDRSEVARLLRVHVAGSMGFPISYFGETDSNKATIEGQNDIMLKTPAARQKEFAGFLNQLVRYTIEQTTGKNPALFRDMQAGYKVGMPEIAAKDIARVGQVLTSAAQAIDTGIANKTMSKQTGVKINAALIRQLGVNVDAAQLAAEITGEADDQQELADALQAELARRAPAPGQPRNPPVPQDEQQPPTD